MNLDKEIQRRIEEWTSAEYDLDTINQVKELVARGAETELLDAFYKELEFGTGGLRGVMGVGSNRINKYTIGKATQGLANYLRKLYPEGPVKVAVSYDSRRNSQALGQLVADVFSANGIYVYLFNELRPTPMLSYAVRHFGCNGGVMLTASHNPKEYNGYKAYWNDGGQLVAPHDKNVIEEVNAIQSVDKIKFVRNEQYIHRVGEDFDELYIQANKALCIHPEIVVAQSDLKIVYSPIHGTGITVVPKALEAWGFKNIHVVAEQAEPNGEFPTVVYPNPEEEDAMHMAMIKGASMDADIVMATDPDADRVGVAVKNLDGKFQLLNGNQIGSLLVYYILSSKKENGTLTAKDYTVKTIVTTDLIRAISNSFGVDCYETLTGFKYIGELMTAYEGVKNYLVGGEESYGFLVGDLVRDKDAVNSCAFIAEMCAYFKSQGKTLFEVLVSLYEQFGCYQEKLISLTRKGKAGAEEIAQMMVDLRENPPQSLGAVVVKEIRDYKRSIAVDIATSKQEVIDLPKSDVLQFITVDGDVISARPSGTEPKIKFYCSVKKGLDEGSSFHELALQLEEKVKRIMQDIVKD